MFRHKQQALQTGASGASDVPSALLTMDTRGAFPGFDGAAQIKIRKNGTIHLDGEDYIVWRLTVTQESRERQSAWDATVARGADGWPDLRRRTVREGYRDVQQSPESVRDWLRGRSGSRAAHALRQRPTNYRGSYSYEEVSASAIPRDVMWWPKNDGQHVIVSYGSWTRDGADSGDGFKRVADLADRTVRYFVRVDED